MARKITSSNSFDKLCKASGVPTSFHPSATYSFNQSMVEFKKINASKNIGSIDSASKVRLS